MKFRINLADITSRLKETVLRFPGTVLAAMVGTTVAIWLTEMEGRRIEIEEEPYFQAIVVALIGLTFTLSTALIAESLKLKRGVNYAVQAIVVVLCAGYYLLLPAEFDTYHLIQVAAFILSFHLLVAVGAILISNKRSFWDFNKATFIRILTAVLYTGTLTVGLELAILAVDELFGIDINDWLYGQLFIFMAGIFNTLMFLAGLPHPARVPEGYPKGLRLFTQYVLIPLTLVYFLILYAYIGKIVIEWDWPKGWVSALIIGYSIVGMLSYLLVYPLRNDESLPWIKIFSRWFYISLLPLSVLLYLAVYVRVADYGITLSRFIGIITAVWLAGIGLYFIISKAKDIRMIPATLAGFILLFSFGPWGVYSVSLKSQYNRLSEYLEKYDRLDSPYTSKVEIPDEDAREMRSAIRYILNMDAKELLRTYHTDLPDSVWDEYTYNLADKLAANWEIPQPSGSLTIRSNWQSLTSDDYLEFNNASQSFSHMVNFSKRNFNDETNIHIEHKTNTIATISLENLLKQLPDPSSDGDSPAAKMMIRHVKPNGDTLHIWFRELNWTLEDGEFKRVNHYHGIAWW